MGYWKPIEMEGRAAPVLMDILYLPPVQYFAHWIQADSPVLEQWAPYTKGTYKNRCMIASANGPLVLSVPLRSGKYLQPLCEVQIAYDEPWQRRHWRSIHDAYRSAPFFEHYADPFDAYFKKQQSFLAEWNLGLMRLVLDGLRLARPLQLTDEFEPRPVYSADLRGGFPFKTRLKRPDASYQDVPYVQVFQDRHGFIPNLSILDLLFCTGPEAPSILRRSIVHSKINPT